MSDEKRPKALRVAKVTPSGLVAATIGNHIKHILTGAKAGYILIVLDEEGASLATSETPEEAINVMSHFAKDTSIFDNGYVVMDCACSHCQSFRRAAKVH